VIDVKAARQDPDRYRAALARRGAERDFDALLAADRSWRSHTERAEALRAAQKRSSKGRPPSPEQIEELRQLKEELAAAEAEQAVAARERDALLDRIPNLPDPTAADGMDEEDAQLVRTWGEQPQFSFEPRDSTELGSPRGWIDMARGARLSGSRFAYRIGDVALAEMALYRFVIDKLTSRGFLLVLPPVLASERAMYGTGFLPTEESNLYQLEKDGLYLTGTSWPACTPTRCSTRPSCRPATPRSRPTSGVRPARRARTPRACSGCTSSTRSRCTSTAGPRSPGSSTTSCSPTKRRSRRTWACPTG
jgi:seryl-tRNA synthetase